ncbi:putative arabinan endo-1,5-alpha-L-arabinosidase A [Cladorrhinum sp. PSN259]|nr:putative arabinan endo-1,5-alpha-L-arabinosidase A [Cladorrhinum sp. PSN259]
MVNLASLSAATLAALLLPASCLVHGYALPEACTGTCTNAHDPSIIRRDDGTYFRFSTNGKIAVHTAPNITGPWTYKGAALPRGPTIKIRGAVDFWAPDVTLVQDTYYMYYSVSSFGSQDSAIGVATSKTLDVGTWTDLGATGVASDRSRPYNAIDGNLINVNGTYHLTFGSFWNGIYQVRMDSPPTRITVSSTPSSSGASASAEAIHQLSYNRADKAQEGPYLFGPHGGYFYLFVSRGSCCGYDRSRPARGKEYKITVCRSADATGPFSDKSGKLCDQGGGTTVLESHDWVYGPGGQGVYGDPTLGPILYYHYVDTRVGYADGQKRFGWNKIDFSSGWPVV